MHHVVVDRGFAKKNDLLTSRTDVLPREVCPPLSEGGSVSREAGRGRGRGREARGRERGEKEGEDLLPERLGAMSESSTSHRSFHLPRSARTRESSPRTLFSVKSPCGGVKASGFIQGVGLHVQTLMIINLVSTKITRRLLKFY